jgi:azurin
MKALISLLFISFASLLHAHSALEIEMRVDDAMKFSVSEIKASPGQKLVVELKNLGNPRANMEHNFILLKKGVDPAEYATKAITAANELFQPRELDDKVIVSSCVIGPGETEKVVFNAPLEEGVYYYLCSFPGHFLIGMKGKLIVAKEGTFRRRN